MMRWEPLDVADLDRVDAIQRVIHAELPERPEFLAEKLTLFPEGCRKLVRDGEMVGYALAHPWRLGEAPSLNATLHPMPAEPDCLHMHDVAILPEGRGAGAAGRYVEHLCEIARRLGLDALACVSVYGTATVWERHGFRRSRPANDLASYGEGALYMVADVAETRWTIRPARIEDAEAACDAIRRSIIELCEQDHGGDPAALEQWLANKTPEIVRTWITANPLGVFAAAREDTAILALGAILPNGEIVLNYVAPEGRFRGISKAMMAALERRARDLGHGACALTSTATAHRFYHALGYADAGPPVPSFGNKLAYPMRRSLTE